MKFHGFMILLVFALLSQTGLAAVVRINSQADVGLLMTAPAGSLVKIARGTFDFTPLGCSVRPQANVIIQGAGFDQTWLINGKPFNSDPPDTNPGCNFELNDGVVYEDVTLESTAPVNTQCCLVGFGSKIAPNGAVATLRRCQLLGRNFTVYNWSAGYGAKITIEDCDIIGGRVLVGNLNSGGADSGYIDVINSRLSVVPTRSTYGGGFRDKCCGVIARGGVTQVSGTQITLLPDPAQPGLSYHGIYTPPEGNDDHTGGSNNILVRIVDTYILVSPTKLARFDLNINTGTIEFSGGSGSGSWNGATYEYLCNQGANANFVPR